MVGTILNTLFYGNRNADVFVSIWTTGVDHERNTPYMMLIRVVICMVYIICKFHINTIDTIYIYILLNEKTVHTHTHTRHTYITHTRVCV